MTQARVTVFQVTCLTPRIGYDQAGAVAKLAMKKGYSLKEAALEMGCVERSICRCGMQPAHSGWWFAGSIMTGEQFDEWVDPSRMMAPKPAPTK